MSIHDMTDERERRMSGKPVVEEARADALDEMGYVHVPEEVWVLRVVVDDPLRLMTAYDAAGDCFVVLSAWQDGLDAFRERYQPDLDYWRFERTTVQEIIGRLRVARGYMMLGPQGEERERRYVR